MRRKLLKWIVIIIGLLVILYISVFAYVSANKKHIIRLVNDEIGERIDGKVSIANIELSFLSHFPRIGVKLHEVLVTDSMFSAHSHPS